MSGIQQLAGIGYELIYIRLTNMNTQDYKDIIDLCEKATKMLEYYFQNNGEMNLKLAKEVAFIFMDGRNVRTDILDKIPVPMRARFADSVLYIQQVSSYISSPRQNNDTNTIYSKILYIKKTIEYLAVETTKKEKKPVKIFYSWQLSTLGKYNNYFIRDCLREAVREINQSIPIEEREQNEDIQIDSDTQGTSGSPHIFTTILDKINVSTIFIVDVSLISKKVCNSNVMLELGYAIKTLGFDNIIMVFNTALGSLDDLPFDLRSLRVSTYSFKDGDDKKQASRYLTNLLKISITTVIK